MALATERRDAVAALPAAGRLREMHGRLERRLEKAGLGAEARERVLDANARAMLHRLEVLGNDEHFETLHSARTLLILLDDCDVDDAETLAAAAGVESAHDALRVAISEPGSAGSAQVPIPASSGETLLEDLVSAPLETRLIALAERLDHARHLHLRPPAEWGAFHESIGSVYLPLAGRSHPRLARRYDWWWRMFRRRFLAGAEPG